MKNLIRKILKEETTNRFIDKVVNYVKAPYFINMEGLGLSKKEYELVLSKIFNQPVSIIGNSVYDEYTNKVYYESSSGFWEKREFDKNGKLVYFEDSKGNWAKYEYDDQGNEIYYENSNGNWYKREYDDQGNRIYFEDSDGEIYDNR